MIEITLQPPHLWPSSRCPSHCWVHWSVCRTAAAGSHSLCSGIALQKGCKIKCKNHTVLLKMECLSHYIFTPEAWTCQTLCNNRKSHDQQQSKKYIYQPEQNAVLQHAPLATLIQQAPPLDVNWLAKLFLPWRQWDFNQVASGVVWSISTVTTWRYHACEGRPPCCPTQPSHQLRGIKHTQNRFICLS